MENLAPEGCLNCGKRLVGRSDKKFCDAYCRNSFNNQHKAKDEVFIQQTNSVIRRNRRILKDLCPEGKATVRKEVLDRMGFNFQFFTSIHKARSQVYFLSYDYAFSPLLEKGVQKALIIQRQESMDQQTFAVWKS